MHPNTGAKLGGMSSELVLKFEHTLYYLMVSLEVQDIIQLQSLFRSSS